jgi:hypothetical protein
VALVALAVSVLVALVVALARVSMRDAVLPAFGPAPAPVHVFSAKAQEEDRNRGMQEVADRVRANRLFRILAGARAAHADFKFETFENYVLLSETTIPAFEGTSVSIDGSSPRVQVRLAADMARRIFPEFPNVPSAIAGVRLVLDTRVLEVQEWTVRGSALVFAVDPRAVSDEDLDALAKIERAK